MKRQLSLPVLCVLTFLACSSSGSGPAPSNPASGRWFGKLVVSSVFDGSNTLDLPGTVKVQQHYERAKTTITIADTGARHTATTVDFFDYQVSDIVQTCLHLHGTNRSEATATASSDTGGYFALRTDGNGGYTSGEFASAVTTPPVTIPSDNYLATTTCDVATTATSTGTETTSFAPNLPLDKIAGTLSNGNRTAAGQAHVDDGRGTTYDLVWSLRRDAEIVAVVDDQTVPRASRVTLDGSKSRGQITDYTWTILPLGAACTAKVPVTGASLRVGKQVERNGPTYEFQTLCTTVAHLHVKGPAGEDDDVGVIWVSPRTWKTSSDRSQTTDDQDNLDSGTFGSNRCSLEGGKPSGHEIHWTSDNQWSGSAFTTGQVTDDGPFQDAFYVASSNVQVDRIELINATVFGPNGAAYKATKAKSGQAIADLLVTQVRAHEAAHTDLLLEWLARNKDALDPARKVEPLASNDEAQLVDAANTSIREDNTQLCNATSHPFVFEKMQANPNNANPLWTSETTICRVENDCPPVPVFCNAAFDDLPCK